MSAKSADFGVIGLGVMGSNLALNMESSGLGVARSFGSASGAVGVAAIRSVPIPGRASERRWVGCGP